MPSPTSRSSRRRPTWSLRQGRRVTTYQTYLCQASGGHRVALAAHRRGALEGGELRAVCSMLDGSCSPTQPTNSSRATGEGSRARGSHCGRCAPSPKHIAPLGGVARPGRRGPSRGREHLGGRAGPARGRVHVRDRGSGNERACWPSSILAWPEGLQTGLSKPVALLIDEPPEVLQLANARGFRYFTDLEDVPGVRQPRCAGGRRDARGGGRSGGAVTSLEGGARSRAVGAQWLVKAEVRLPMRLFSADPGCRQERLGGRRLPFGDGPEICTRRIGIPDLPAVVAELCSAAQRNHVLLSLDAPLRAFGGLQSPSSFEPAGTAEGGRAWPFNVNPFSQRPCEHALSSKPTVVNGSLVAPELAQIVAELCGWDPGIRASSATDPSRTRMKACRYSDTWERPMPR